MLTPSSLRLHCVSTPSCSLFKTMTNKYAQNHLPFIPPSAACGEGNFLKTILQRKSFGKSHFGNSIIMSKWLQTDLYCLLSWKISNPINIGKSIIVRWYALKIAEFIGNWKKSLHSEQSEITSHLIRDTFCTISMRDIKIDVEFWRIFFSPATQIANLWRWAKCMTFAWNISQTSTILRKKKILRI